MDRTRDLGTAAAAAKVSRSVSERADLQTNGQLALVAKSLHITEHQAIDVARMGAICAHGYDCRWRTIDAKVSPQNRLLIGLASVKPSVALKRSLVEKQTADKLKLIYGRLLTDKTKMQGGAGECDEG